MYSNEFNESIFYRKQIIDKMHEIIGLQGVEQFTNFGQNGEQYSEQSNDQQFQIGDEVQYFVIEQCKITPSRVLSMINDDTTLFFEKSAKIVPMTKKLTQQNYKSIYLFLEMRKKEATVEIFKYLVEQNGQIYLHQVYDIILQEDERQLLDQINNINKKYEWQGIQIRSVVFEKESWKVRFKLGQQIITYQINRSIFTSTGQLQRFMKAAIISSITSDIEKGRIHSKISMNQVHSIPTYKTVSQLQFGKKIELFFILKNKFDICLNIQDENSQLKQTIFSKANNRIYLHNILHLVQISQSQQLPKEQTTIIYQIIQAQPEEVISLFEKLYRLEISGRS